MSKYLIEIRYPPDEQLDTMERMMRHNTDLLCMTYWGDLEGQPTAWLVVLANAEKEARDMLPEGLRDRARIAQIQLLTPQDVEEMRRLAKAA